MPRPPAISVLIPVYNGQDYIAAAIDSVLAQTMTDFELVIVDDGSTDRTHDIVAAYADPRIVFLSPGHHGVSGALNHGLARCRAELVARLDADDEMEPNRLEHQLAFMAQHPEIGAAASYYWMTDATGAIRGATDPPLHTVADVEHHIAKGGRLIYAAPTMIFRRRPVLERGGYDPAYDSVEDVELFVRMHEAGWPTIVQPERLTRFRIHGSSVSARSHRRQHYLVGAVFENFARRRRGRPTVSVEDYIAHSQRSLLARLRIEAKLRSYDYLRRHQLAKMHGRPLAAAAHVLLAGVLNPRSSFAKLWRQATRASTPGDRPIDGSESLG